MSGGPSARSEAAVVPTGDSSGCHPASTDAAFDQPLTITLFRGTSASTKTEVRITMQTLAHRIQTTAASEKTHLPWLKLARFGNARSGKNSLRHDANVQAITGVEADYDGGVVPFEEVAELLLKAGILSLLYTSPSHREDAPRWRVLCPTSVELEPGQRNRILGRLNGVLRGVVSGESWTLSQSYFFGRVQSNPSHRVQLIEGAHLDLLDELDESWWGKNQARTARELGDTEATEAFNEQALLAEITTGKSYHVAYVRLLGRWARNGIPMMESRQRLLAAMDEVPPAERSGRWEIRRADVDRCLEDIYVKEGSARDKGIRPSASLRGSTPDANEEPWPEPVNFLTDSDLTGLPELRADHLPDALYPFVVDTAARMGVDPVSVALAAIVTCASVIHEDWQIQPKQYDSTWVEQARLWGAIVGDPSILKSPVIAACTRPIEHLDAEARRRHAAEVRTYDAKVAATQKGADQESEPADAMLPPRLDRYLVEGTTIEALTEVLRDDVEAKQRAPQGRVLVRQDEMSEWLASFDRYRGGGRGGADRGAYLRLFNGGRYVLDRINRGSFAMPSWSACILGGIQPAPIQKIAQETADDGLLQRFLYSVPERQGIGVDRLPDAPAIARYHSLISALLRLAPREVMRLPSGCDIPPIVMVPESHRHRFEIDELARAVASLPDASARIKAALGKWHGIFARLALCFHLIDCADAVACGTRAPVQVISEATTSRTARMMREVLLPHLLRAEAVMYSSAQSGHARWIAGFILSRPSERLALRDVLQAYGALRLPERRRELLDVMESLVSMGWLRPEEQANPSRATAAWRVNPIVHTRFPSRAAKEREARAHARQHVQATLLRMAKAAS
jgi:hypothetical protein